MGYDYLWVHILYTIPPAAALSFCYRPLGTALDRYKILFLIGVAVVSTTPWDSYLIRTRIWSYPANAIVGPTLFQIPAEELFFFGIQTYITSLLYLLFSKPTFHPIYLCGEQSRFDGKQLQRWRWLGTVAGVVLTVYGAFLVINRGKGTYLGLILLWAIPFVLLLWNLAYQFILQLPLTSSLIPIVLPSLYLWLVDTVALRRGTWVIESGTKSGLQIWRGLDIEEAFFFLITNVLIVFGLIAFDNALAVLQAFPSLFPIIPSRPSPALLIRALLTPTRNYDLHRIAGMQQALVRLEAKSRSFYLASSVFEGRLRIDLILLYSFCRVADDLVDNATSIKEAEDWIRRLTQYLDISYSKDTTKITSRESFISANFPKDFQAALILLPTPYLSPTPLYDLLRGFETDLHFSSLDNPFPIHHENALETYGARVAGTVAELCIELVYHHTNAHISKAQRQYIVHAGGRMGVALQYVNIARDITVDASVGRVYLPSSWLKEQGLDPKDVISDPSRSEVEFLRQRLINKAMAIHSGARGAIEKLPVEARGPMRVAVESYVEIGRVLRTPGYRIKAGRATVSKLRRLRVAWSALTQ